MCVAIVWYEVFVSLYSLAQSNTCVFHQVRWFGFKAPKQSRKHRVEDPLRRREDPTRFHPQRTSPLLHELLPPTFPPHHPHQQSLRLQERAPLASGDHGPNHSQCRRCPTAACFLVLAVVSSTRKTTFLAVVFSHSVNCSVLFHIGITSSC